MTYPELIGTDPRVQRQLFFLGVASVDGLLAGLRLSDEPFTCLLVWDSGQEPDDSIHAVAELLARSACLSVCVFGDDTSRLRTCLSEALAANESPAALDARHPTIEPSGSSLDQCLSRFLQPAAIDSGGPTECRYGIAIVIAGSRDRLRYVRDALRDHVHSPQEAAPQTRDAPGQGSTSGSGVTPWLGLQVREDEGLQSPEDGPEARDRPTGPHPEWKHSRFGIASFILALAMGLCLLLAFGLVGMYYMESDGVIDEESPLLVVVGLLFVGACLGNVLALALGVAGLIEKRRKRTFSVLGTVFSALGLLFVVLLVVASVMLE